MYLVVEHINRKINGIYTPVGMQVHGYFKECTDAIWFKNDFNEKTSSFAEVISTEQFDTSLASNKPNWSTNNETHN